MTMFDGALFDNGVFHAGGSEAVIEECRGAGKGRRKIRKVRYAWRQKHAEYEKMISRRK